MESTINAIFTVLGIVLTGAMIGPVYRAVKTETLLKVQHGLPSLEAYTQKLTGISYPPMPKKPQKHASLNRTFSK